MDNNEIPQNTKLNTDNLVNSIKSIQMSEVSEELKHAIKLLRKHKLLESAKWASELLLSTLNENKKNDSNLTSPFSDNTTSRNLTALFAKTDKQNVFSNSLFINDKDQPYTDNNYVFRLSNSNRANTQFPQQNKQFFKANTMQETPTQNYPQQRLNSSYLYSQLSHLKQVESNIKDILAYASSLFDLREYQKCSYILKAYAKPNYSSAQFLYFYCEYLLIEQKKQEDQLDTAEIGSKSLPSRDYVKIQQQLEPLYLNNQLDAFSLYLYAIVLKELGLIDQCKAALVKCLNEFPYLWSAWVELSLITKQSEMKFIFSELKEHWMKHFMIANFLQEKNHETEAITLLTSLSLTFTNSSHLLNSLAHAYYLLHEYDSSKEYFEKLIAMDPCRYENLDTYSNILFIKESFCELANLAYRCFQNDKYRPETCCIIGNYYSLKNDHVKAIVYFKRAIKLDINFLSAWTLMGHEFLEMKNIPSAIESYRTAVDIDANDYRAWYGLGQTYEIHQMYQYAIYYFLNAANAKPNDSRMWTALASCYEKLEKKQEAVKCYKKALMFKDKEGIALYKIAKLYVSLGEEEKAAAFFEENMKKCNSNNEEIESSEYIDTSIFLAKYYKNQDKLEKAYNYLIKLKDYEGQEKDDIHSMMREIKNINSAKSNK